MPKGTFKIVRDAIDAYEPAVDLTQNQEQELLAIAHAKVKEAITRTEETIKKVDHCLENLSAAKGAKFRFSAKDNLNTGYVHMRLPWQNRS